MKKIISFVIALGMLLCSGCGKNYEGIFSAGSLAGGTSHFILY